MRITLLLLWMVLIPTQGSFGSYESGPSKSFRARSIGNSPRVKKSTDPFTDFHEKMALTARVFAGISLRIGLHDGSMAGDDVIKELLSIDGSVDLDAVKNFKKADVDALFAQLHGLDLVVDSEVDEIENMVLLMSELVEMSEKTDPVDAAVMSNYIGRVEKLNTINFELKLFTAASNFFQKAFPLIKSYKNDRASLLVTEFGTLKQSLGIIEKIATDARKLHGNLRVFKDLFDDSFFKTPYVKTIVLFNKYYHNKFLLQKPSEVIKPKLIEFFNKCKDFSTKLEGLKDQVFALTAITTSRTSRRPPLKFTSGFVNGFADMKELSMDSKDDWLKKAIPEYEADLVESELKPLANLTTHLKDVDDIWDFLSIEKLTQTGREVKKIQKMFQIDLTTATTKGDAALTTLGSFQVPKDDPIFYQIPKEIIEAVVEYRTFLRLIWIKLEQLVNMEDFKLFENMKFSTFIPTSSNNLNVILNKMRKFDDVYTLESTLQILEPKFVELQRIFANDSLKNVTKKVIDFKGKPEINAFVSSTEAAKLKGYFTKLKGVSELKVLSESVALIKYIRTTQAVNTFKKDIEEITKIIADSQSKVDSARAVPATIKSTQTPGIDRLLKLKGLFESSKAFGGSVAVLNTVQKLLRKKRKIVKLLEEGGGVLEEIDGIAHTYLTARELSMRKKNLKKLWGSFDKTWSYFNKLKEDLPSRRAEVTASSALLNETVEQFKHFTGIADFQEDLRPNIEVLNVLALFTPSVDHQEIKKTMEDLMELDLDFSSYSRQLSQVSGQVQQGIKLFANETSSSESTTASSTSESPESPRRTGKGSHPSSSPSSDQQPSEYSDGSNAITICMVAIVILVVLIVICLVAARP